jgi:hypothetical protein
LEPVAKHIRSLRGGATLLATPITAFRSWFPLECVGWF